MKKYFLILMSFFVLLALFGCVPTPEEEFIKQKDSNTMLEQAKTNENGTMVIDVLASAGINSTENNSNGNLPIETYQYEATDSTGFVHLKVDAKIVLPDVEYLPIARVSSVPFTEAEVEALYRALQSDTVTIASDGPLFKGFWQPTLDDLTKQYQNGVYDDKYDTAEDVMKAMQDVMQKMEKEPDKPIPIKPDFSFQKLDDYSLTAEIIGVREDRYVSRLSVQNNTDADYMTAWVEAEYIRDIQQYGLLNRSIEAHSMSRGSTISSRWGMLYENNIPIVPPQIEESIAFRMAEQVIETAELRDYVCTGKCVAPFYQHLEDIRDGCPGKYEFIFTRKVNGAAETFMNTAIACGSEEEAVRAEWPYERIHIYVDDQGIFAFLFYGKSKVSQIINPQATMLPFSEIQSIFEKQFLVRCGDYVAGRTGDGERTYEITEVRLGLQRIFEKDRLVDGLLVPTWSFFGTYTDEKGFKYGLDGHDAWFTINAVDGTIIDPYIGY